jgi:PAS domain S-box-containing protein
MDDLRRASMFLAVMESSSVAYTVFDRSGSIVSLNGLARRRIKEIYGKVLQEGSSIFDIVLPENRASFDAHFAQCLGGDPVSVELPIPRSGEADRLYKFTYYPIAEPDREPWGVCLAVEDLKPLRTAQKIARDQQDQLRTFQYAVEQSPASIVITDPDGTIEYANPRFSQITGYAPEEAVGQNPRILKSGNQDEVFYRTLWSTLAAGKSWHGEFRNRRKDGTFFWEDARIGPLRDDAGKIVHYIGVKEDISERKATELRLQTLLAEKDVLIQELYHRTKNNLQTVSALLSLQLLYSPSPELSRLTSTIRGRIHALSTVQNHLFAVQNLHSIVLRFLVQDLVSQAVADRLVPGQEIRQTLEIPDLEVSLDTANSLGMIFQELTTNSMVHAFKSGEAGRIMIAAARRDDQLELLYSDDGPGLTFQVDLGDPQTFGFFIIANMVQEQLRGTLELLPPSDVAEDRLLGGFRCRIRIPQDAID